MRWREPAAGAALTLALAACTTVLTGADAVGGRVAPFEECAPPYAFAGQTTLGALGLEELGGPEADRVGMVWITQEPMTEAEFAPPGGGGPDRFGPVVCVEWADGSGMSTIIDGGWQPVGIAVGGGSRADDGGGGTLGLIGAAIAVAVLAGVSYLAFRRENSHAA